MNRIGWLGSLSLACVLTAAISAGALGETVTKTVTMDGGDVNGQPCSLDELGAVVAHVGDEFKVLFIMEPASRLKEYQEVDLRAEDRLLMLNGKKLTSIEQLKEVLNSMPVGENIQLGIKRDKDMKIVTYPKADPKNLPKVTRKFVTQEVGPGGAKTSEQTFTSANSEGVHVAVLKGTGLVVRENEEHLEIMYRMPLADSIEALADLKEGDQLVSLQGKKPEGLEALESIWNGLATGADVKLVCARAGVEHTYTFAKPDASKDQGGAVMITK